MAKQRATDGTLLRSLPWTLTALCFSVLPHIPYLPIWITGAFAICAALRLYVEYRRKRLPARWIRVALALGSFFGVFAIYENISGVGPGSALLIIMAALKLLETHQRRDQFVLLFISVFLIMASLLREQYLWSLPFLVIGTLITMTAWLGMSPGQGASIRRNFLSSSRLLLYAAPLTLAMWILFPRLSSPFWAVPVDSSQATSGLSESMSPGDISSLSLSNKVAFRVDFVDQVPPPKDLYWRGLVLYNFNGRTWTGANEAIGHDRRDNVEYLGAPISYQVTLEPTAQHTVFALDVPLEWSIDRTTMGLHQQLARERPIDQRISYKAVSHTTFRSNRTETIFDNNYYRGLPEEGNARTRALAKNMREAVSSETDFIEDVLRMFNEQAYFYTLEPPQLGRNPVDQFLFEARQGFCEHYASAFAVMMRAVGIPTRIVLGYQGGELNNFGNYSYMIVRQSDAHAWTEVWLENRGWVRVDPTAAVAPERISAGMSGARLGGLGASWGFSSTSELLHNLTLKWDALNAKWNEWILGYGPENQTKFLKLLGIDDPDWRRMMLTLIGIITVMIVIISGLLVRRYRAPKIDEASLLYRRFVRQIGIQPIIGETPRLYARRVQAQGKCGNPAINDITEQYLLCRYGPDDTTAMRRLRAAVNDFAVAA